LLSEDLGVSVTFASFSAGQQDSGAQDDLEAVAEHDDFGFEAFLASCAYEAAARLRTSSAVSSRSLIEFSFPFLGLKFSIQNSTKG
jgi:hypothetical protein